MKIKRLLAALLVGATLLGLCACGTARQRVGSFNRAEVKKNLVSAMQLDSLEAATDREIFDFYTGDFAGSGSSYAYAITASEDGKAADGLTKADIWLIYGSTAEKIHTAVMDYAAAPPQLAETSYGDLLLIQEAGGEDIQGRVWLVSEGKQSSCDFCISGRVVYEGNDDFAVYHRFTDSVVDANAESIGADRERKLYFMWNGEQLCEYGAIEITAAQLLTYSGASQILEWIDDGGYKVESILFRLNNIININYSKADGANTLYENATVYYGDGVAYLIEQDNGGTSPLARSTYGGRYGTAEGEEELVVYPYEFIKNNKND